MSCGNQTTIFTEKAKEKYFSVKVKWGKETFSDVEVNTEDDPALFKAQIFALTGVLPERQKVVCKGVTLRDDSWANFKLVNVSSFEYLYFFFQPVFI